MMMFAYVLTIFISQGLLTVYRLQYGLHMLLRESLEVSAMQACLMCQDAHMVDICSGGGGRSCSCKRCGWYCLGCMTCGATSCKSPPPPPPPPLFCGLSMSSLCMHMHFFLSFFLHSLELELSFLAQQCSNSNETCVCF